MASPAVQPDFSQIGLSTKDAWLIYRLAYFPGVKREKRLALLDEEGVTDAGRRIGMFLIGEDVPDLSDTARFIASKYKEAAQRERLSLPSGMPRRAVRKPRGPRY